MPENMTPVSELLPGTKFVNVDVFGVRTELTVTAPVCQSILGRWYVQVRYPDGQCGLRVYFPTETVEVIAL